VFSCQKDEKTVIEVKTAKYGVVHYDKGVINANFIAPEI
jgi:hypothetical protein